MSRPRSEDRLLSIGLFTHTYLEPTHHATAQILQSVRGVRYRVFARRIAKNLAFEIPTVDDVTFYWRGAIPQFDALRLDVVQAIFDGRTALRAAARAKEAGYPLIISFHGGFDTNAKIFDPRYRKLTSQAAEYASALTVVSATDRSRLRSIGIETPIEIIPVPIDPVALRGPWPPPAGDLVVVGRLVPKKGIDTLLRALTLLPETRAVVVGDGEERERLVALASELGVARRVRWTGLLGLNEMLAEIAGAACLVHPARIGSDGNAEGTPQAILWAQALGRPVVSTRTGSIGDIVTDGDDGLLVPPDDPGLLAGAIEEATAPSTSVQLGRSARARVLRERDPRRIVAQWERLYRTVATAASI